MSWRSDLAAAVEAIRPTWVGPGFVHIHAEGGSPTLESLVEQGAERQFAVVTTGDAMDGGVMNVDTPLFRYAGNVVVCYAGGPEQDAARRSEMIEQDQRDLISTLRDGATWVGTDVDACVVGAAYATRVDVPVAEGVLPPTLSLIPFTVETWG